MNQELFKLVDWSEYDSYGGERSVFKIETLFESLSSSDEQEQIHGYSGIVQWPIELCRQIGRLNAIPKVVDCLFDLLAVSECSNEGMIIDAINSLTKDIGIAAFSTQFFCGKRADLISSVMKSMRLGEATLIQKITSQDPDCRRAAAQCASQFSSKLIRDTIVKQIEVETNPNAIAAQLDFLAQSTECEGVNLSTLDVDSENQLVKSAYNKLLALCHRPYPNRGLSELCASAFSGYGTAGINSNRLEVSSYALKAIEELKESTWPFSICYWLDWQDSVKDEFLVDYVHALLENVISWFGHHKYEEPEQPPLLVERFLASIAEADRYWRLSDGQADRERASILSYQYSIQANRESLLERFSLS